MHFTWKSYLLRPSARQGRDREKFVRYTRSWSRPASEDDAGTFREWSTDFGPPSHSVPPHLIAKAAGRIDSKAAVALRDGLFQAYFADNLDITDPETMRALWSAAGLPPDRFDESADPELLQQVLDDHKEAMHFGVNGVPAIMLEGNDTPITGAHPRSLYRRWIDRTLAARAS